MKKINFIFFGTPDVAAETLDILKFHGYLPSLIVTAPDKPQGRKMILTSPPVKVWAEKNNIPFLQPKKLEKPGLSIMESPGFSNSDLSIVVAYGHIFPEWLINLPKYGTLNIHYSLLPQYRGAAPVQTAILNGNTETGVTIQKMMKELDAGPIVAQEKIEIKPDEKTPELLNRLVKVGSELLIKILPDYVSGKIKPFEQKGEPSFSQKIKKNDGLINLDGDPIKNYNKFRAFAGWPRIYFFKDGKRIIITDVELKDGKFVIKKIIPEGKKEMSYASFISKTSSS